MPNPPRFLSPPSPPFTLLQPLHPREPIFCSPFIPIHLDTMRTEAIRFLARESPRDCLPPLLSAVRKYTYVIAKRSLDWTNDK